MTPQRRAALVSVVAALALIAVKLASGLTSGSLGLVAESLHSGTDLVAALLTLLAVGIAVRPADRGHQYGHGKAEHLAALAEAAVLSLVSVAVAGLAVARLAGWVATSVDAHWWVFVAVAVVLAIDLSRTVVSLRTARRYHSAALLSNALHFGSDFAGTIAVLVGLVSVRAGWQSGDAVAALFVAILVLAAAARLMRRNIDVLMDRAPADAVAAARAAIVGLVPAVQLRRLRLRHAGDGRSSMPSSACPRVTPSSRGMRPPTGSRRPCTGRCREATWSCTWSRSRTRQTRGSGYVRPRWGSRRCARSTTCR